jgi:uncharacterized membrane protein HdeD (DUF308 family)
MLRGTKPSGEVRFELVTTGSVLVTAAVLYVTAYSFLPGLMLFFPGLILLGGAIYQDMQPEWTAGWLTYLVAILLVATGLASIVNTLLGNVIQLNWIVIAVVELGVLLILKALYDPNPKG